MPFDEPVTFTNLALLITFTLSLVQALLSLIGAVISCLWSPCCFSSPALYKPVTAPTYYSPTTPPPPHRYEVIQNDSHPFLDSLFSLLSRIHLHQPFERSNELTNTVTRIDSWYPMNHPTPCSMVFCIRPRRYGAITMKSKLCRIVSFFPSARPCTEVLSCLSIIFLSKRTTCRLFDTQRTLFE